MKGIAEPVHDHDARLEGGRLDREQLRRLPKEFFRYRPEAAGLLDGAVFAFVKGTDRRRLLPRGSGRRRREGGASGVALRDRPADVRGSRRGWESRSSWTALAHVFRRAPTKTFFSADGPLAAEARSKSALRNLRPYPRPSQDVPK